MGKPAASADSVLVSCYFFMFFSAKQFKKKASDWLDINLNQLASHDTSQKFTQ
jgi:hypothetical protein